MLYADNTGVVSQSAEQPRKMMRVIVAVYAVFGITVSEVKGEIMCPSWVRPRQDWRACPAKHGDQVWREATRAFGSLVKHP